MLPWSPRVRAQSFSSSGAVSIPSSSRSSRAALWRSAVVSGGMSRRRGARRSRRGGASGRGGPLRPTSEQRAELRRQWAGGRRRTGREGRGPRGPGAGRNCCRSRGPTRGRAPAGSIGRGWSRRRRGRRRGRVACKTPPQAPSPETPPVPRLQGLFRDFQLCPRDLRGTFCRLTRQAPQRSERTSDAGQRPFPRHNRR